VKSRFLVPEIVQTSAMDCGPASLKALLEGFGIHASYGRLREACQTDVDGTSIDTLEDIAIQLGLDAEQVVVPPDHVLADTPRSLPALVVVRLPNGFTHFVVAWRKIAGYVQIMDPATGRRWIRTDRFLSDLYVHTTPVPASGFEEWIASDDFTIPFRRRLEAIGCGDAGSALLARAEGWRDRAALDAATRWTTQVVKSGAFRVGAEAAAALEVAYEQARAEGETAIDRSFWTGLPTTPDADGEEQVALRGAVVVRVAGPRGKRGSETAEAPVALAPDLVRALEEPAPKPWRTLAQLLRGDGATGTALRGAIVAALAAAALGGVLEAILLSGTMSIGRELGVVQQRLGAVGALLVLVTVLLAIEAPAAWGISRLGRRLETRLRVAFLEKLPRLGDRYFASRPVSDMAERCHAGQRVRLLPEVATTALRLIMELVVTVAGITWLDPAGAPWALLAAAGSAAIPMSFLPTLAERDMKTRTHEGAIARFYLDALLGLSPIRTHGAERAVAREHESLLVEWARSARAMVAAYVSADLAQSLVGTLLAAGLLFRYVRAGGDPSGVILLVYWALAIPMLGQEIGLVLRQLPGHRNTTLRLLEPLGAAEDDDESGTAQSSTARDAVAIAFEDVRVVASGHVILTDVALRIAPGEHVAVIGASGAGKSSFLGLLLGWHRASSGRVLVDGAPLDGEGRRALRESCAWVDPAVQLWNRPLIDNLLYGAPGDAPSNLGRAIDAAELAAVLEKLPDGMQTALGEGGGLVSGGEGQRVRLARGLLRQDARLVLLDEPFRGLDRDRRHALMARARAWWKSATLLCVTHDVRETSDFDRVLVVEGGRVVEDGAPSELLAQASRYRAMIEAEGDVLRDVWGDPSWRRLRLDAGRLLEVPQPLHPQEPS
jgi:ATP-binding cassette subfamily B protein